MLKSWLYPSVEIEMTTISVTLCTKLLTGKNLELDCNAFDCNTSIAYQTTKKGEYVNMKLAKTIQAKTKKNTKKEVLKYIKIKSNKRKLHTPREKTRKRQGS